ncbi:hypothetical protein B0H19DRAFT_1273692 [Mycena capillaripes]|nr:hypothetical protein B0H19DRAFT_1274815 [Mycena capillaripes]KAJ6530708.1 hypothetical protein B0H19DRAFT_1273692 [Mycena capillaripes]
MPRPDQITAKPPTRRPPTSLRLHVHASTRLRAYAATPIHTAFPCTYAHIIRTGLPRYICLPYQRRHTLSTYVHYALRISCAVLQPPDQLLIPQHLPRSNPPTCVITRTHLDPMPNAPKLGRFVSAYVGYPRVPTQPNPNPLRTSPCYPGDDAHATRLFVRMSPSTPSAPHQRRCHVFHNHDDWTNSAFLPPRPLPTLG